MTIATTFCPPNDTLAASGDFQTDENVVFAARALPHATTMAMTQNRRGDLMKHEPALLSVEHGAYQRGEWNRVR
jgi:hypothetical protein